MSNQITTAISASVRPVAVAPARDVASAPAKAPAPHVQLLSDPAARPETAAPASGKDVPAPAPKIADLKKMVERLNEFVSDVQRDLKFSVDDASGRTVITVYHAETGEIVRQIPSEEALQIARAVAEGSLQLIDSEA